MNYPIPPDKLAHDLLTLPEIVGGDTGTLQGLVLINPEGPRVPVRYVCWDTGEWLVNHRHRRPDSLHATGWRVDLDKWASAGVLLAVLTETGRLKAVVSHHGDGGRVSAWQVETWDAVLRDGVHTTSTTYIRPTLAEAAARALMGVSRGF